MTREEALNKVRQMSLPKETMEILEALAPELKESEDERIRKELIGMIKECTNWVHKKEYITYLEKQKDSASNNFDDVWNEENCEEIIAEGQKLTPRFKELLKEVCHAWYDRGAKLEKQKEQKPVEWSEEDEKDMAHIIRILDDCYVYGTHDLSKTDHENLVNKLKSLRPSWKPSKEQMRALNEIVNILAASPFLHQNDYLFNILNGLREELKKLL